MPDHMENYAETENHNQEAEGGLQKAVLL